MLDLPRQGEYKNLTTKLDSSGKIVEFFWKITFWKAPLSNRFIKDIIRMHHSLSW